METSSARNHSKFSSASSSLASSGSGGGSSKMMKKSKTYSDNFSSGGATNYDSGASSYQNGGPVDLNSSEFKNQRDGFFDRVQRENANRPE